MRTRLYACVVGHKAKYVRGDVLSVEVITDQLQFQSLRDAWRDLAAASDNDCLYSAFEWLSTWWRHFGRDMQLFVLVARAGYHPVGIAPFTLSRREGFRLATLMGGTVTDYKDFIIDRNADHFAVLGELFHTLVSHHGIDVVRFEIREDSPNFAPLGTLLPSLSAYRPTCAESNIGVYVEPKGAIDEYWHTLGRGFRENCRRQISRLRALEGGFTYYCPETPEEIERYVSVLMQQKIDRWRQTKHRTVLMEHTVVRDFYQDVAKQIHQAGWLRVPVLLVNGRAAAVDVGAVYRDKYYSCQHSFDEDFSTYSVGRLLNLEIIRWAHDNHWNQMDLGVGGEAYKFDFKPRVRKLYTLAFYQTGARGHAAEAWFGRVRPRLEHVANTRSFAKPVREWLKSHNVH
jgi:CelD/BcsL family acetyltransferase involved in cellulose biosynthesis